MIGSKIFAPHYTRSGRNGLLSGLPFTKRFLHKNSRDDADLNMGQNVAGWAWSFMSHGFEEMESSRAG